MAEQQEACLGWPVSQEEEMESVPAPIQLITPESMIS